MGSRHWIALAIVFLGALVPDLLSAQGDSGFLRGKGRTDFAFSYSQDRYSEFWNGEKKVADDNVGTIKRQSFNLYVAHGLTDDVDLSFSLAYTRASSSGIFDDEADLQDAVVQLKCRLVEFHLGSATVNVLAAPAVKLPLTDYEDDNVTAIGDGQTDFRGRGIVQVRFPCSTFLAVETGYDVRSQDPPDEFQLHATAGTTIGDRATISIFYSLVRSLGGHDIGAGSFPGVEEEYDRLGFGVYFRLTNRIGMSASSWTTLNGLNTGDVEGYSVGLVIAL
ncbi:MAG: hypothetical protein KDC38_20420 [Planctomycetes bacterium]|nr:hypothetical protein [Planctomycetota bacterium]